MSTSKQSLEFKLQAAQLALKAGNSEKASVQNLQSAEMVPRYDTSASSSTYNVFASHEAERKQSQEVNHQNHSNGKMVKPPTRHYIEIEDDKVEYYTGCNINYYGEYHAKRKTDKKYTVSFPIDRCDPLPLEKFGEIKLFFTSAIEGNVPQPGIPCMITDASITQILAVRARANSNNHRAQIYIGFDPADFKRSGYKDCNALYAGKILAIQYKNTTHVECTGCYLGSGVRHLTNMELSLEVRKYLTDSKDFSWKSPVFQKKIQEFLPQRSGVCFCWESQMLFMRDCYWTKDENKLKDIKYNQANKAQYTKR